MRDDGAYSFTCPLGHDQKFALQEHPFEVLAEIGANAIVDSYYREAVSAFSAALERFYEFSTNVLSIKAGLSYEQVTALWHPLRKWSERQLGAFVALWSHAFTKPPELLAEARRSFRNDVIHKGRLPTRIEATEFGQCVLDLIRSQMEMLLDTAEPAIQQLVLNRNGVILEKLGPSAGVTSISTVVSLNSENGYSLNDHISLLVAKRQTEMNAKMASEHLQNKVQDTFPE